MDNKLVVILLVCVITIVADAAARRPPSARGNLRSGNGRIVGGTSADEGDFPYIVTVSLAEDLICSGFIYNSEWIVTAASCLLVDGEPVDPAEVKIGVGQASLVNQEPEEATYQAVSVKIHEDYDPVTNLNNLGLIQVETAIAFSGSVDFLCYDEEIGVEKATVMGWGAREEGGLVSTRLQSIQVTMNGDCSVYGQQFDRNYMICAGVKEDGGGPCAFDEGSPLVYYVQDDDGNVVQEIGIGIVALQRECARDPFFSAVYTRLSPYFRWFQNNVGFQEGCPKEPNPPTDRP